MSYTAQFSCTKLMSVVRRHDQESRPTWAITSYLADRDDSRLPQHIASQSRLPVSAGDQAHDYDGLHRIDTTTSLLLSGCDHTLGSVTPSQDLPAITRESSVATSTSISSSFGIRQLSDQRLLDQDNGGALILPHWHTPQILECPFNHLFCYETFSSMEDWITHSLTHFGTVGPSTSNKCCFCEAVFNFPTGLHSWVERMNHVAHHHKIGHKLAHAQPDFELFTYLWNHRLIKNHVYRDLKGNNEDRSRAVAAYPSPPVSPNERSVAYTETARNTRRERERQSR